MSHITKQDELVAKLVTLYSGSNRALSARLAKAQRAFVAALTDFGYTFDEATDSFFQCDDMAQLQVNAQ